MCELVSLIDLCVGGFVVWVGLLMVFGGVGVVVWCVLVKCCFLLFVVVVGCFIWGLVSLIVWWLECVM